MKKLYSFILLSINTAYAMDLVKIEEPQCSLQVFEVGQGNCTLVSYNGLPLILIDGGTTAFEYSQNPNFISDKAAEIRRCLVEHKVRAKTNVMSVIVSHPDTDHYNLLSTIITDFIMDGGQIDRVILGGSLGFYDPLFQQFLISLHGTKGTIIWFPTQHGDTNQVIHLFTPGPFSCDLLPALCCTSKKGSNASSLVIKLAFGSIACLVMGDANGKTTDHILKSLRYKVPETFAAVKILIASHHGSIKKECNSDWNWLQYVQPECVIFSSGIHVGHQHPHGELVKQLRSRFKKKHVTKKGFHPLYAQMGEGAKVTFANGYALYILSDPMYGTLAQGTLTFLWTEKEQSVPLPKVIRPYQGDNLVDWVDEKVCLFAAVLQPPYEVFELQHLKLLDFSKMDLDDSNPQDPLWFTVVRLLQELRIRGNSLEDLCLNDNKLQLRDTLLLLRELYNARNIAFAPTGTLQALVAKNNHFSEEHIEEFFGEIMRACVRAQQFAINALSVFNQGITIPPTCLVAITKWKKFDHPSLNWRAHPEQTPPDLSAFAVAFGNLKVNETK